MAKSRVRQSKLGKLTQESTYSYAKLRSMTRFEVLGRIVEHLHSLDDPSLEAFLTELSTAITDEKLQPITHGKNDTEHLYSSPVNSKDLDEAVKELKDLKLLTPQHAT